ncbi:hypothetical protein ABBQ38_004659 [Trebouxia sp. C0009 RCD-2024]
MKPDRISNQRGRGSDKDVRKKRERHPADQQLYSHIRAQSYHRQHLLDLLKQAIDEQDHNRAAVAAVVLLAAQDPSYVPGPEMVPGAKTSQFFPDVAAAALEVLRQQVSTEELKRYLRKLHDRQINSEQAELVTFELVYLLAERGDYQEAYDVLDSSNDKRTQQFHRAAVSGFLRHAQVSEILERTAKHHTSGQPGQSDQPKVNMFQHDEQVWTKGGQQLQEFWNGAEAHLKDALRLQPGAVAEGCLLAQLYMMAGLPHDALETGRALRLNAPADADAHALFILMKEAEGPTQESMPELAQAYVEMLRCDPTSQHAVQGLLGLHSRLPVNPSCLLEAAALHLDAADEHSASAVQAWTALAQTLNDAAKRLSDLQAKAAAAVCEDNQAATTADGPREGGSPVDKRRQAGAYNEQHEGLPSSAEERKEGQPLGPDGQAERQPSGAERQAEDAELEAARGVWQVFQDLLPVQRYWWQKLHFRWQEPLAASDPFEPPDDPDHMAVLRAKAITAALMYSDHTNVGSGDTGAAFVPRVQEHIEAAGEFGIAQDIEDAVELGQTVQQAINKQAQAVEGMPFGTPLAEYGMVSNLPQVWWSVFPFKRREQLH